MKKLLMVLVVVFLLALPCFARTVPAVGYVDGSILHTIQEPWLIADETTSAGDEPNALGVTERTLLTVKAAAEGGDDEISIYTLDSEWNAIRLRAIGITDGGTRTDEIYIGSLGGGKDCELSYAGQLAWVVGTQQSVYDQITFTSGGTFTAVLTGIEVTADFTPVSMELTIPSMTGSDAIEETAAFTPVSMEIAIPSMTPTWVAPVTAEFTPVSMEIAVPNMTGVYALETIAAFTPVSMEMTIPSMTPTYEAELTAAFTPVSVEMTIPARDAFIARLSHAFSSDIKNSITATSKIKNLSTKSKLK